MIYKGYKYDSITDPGVIDTLDSEMTGLHSSFSTLMDKTLTASSGGGGILQQVFSNVASGGSVQLDASSIVSVAVQSTMTNNQITVGATDSIWTGQNVQYQIASFIVDNVNTSGHFVDGNGLQVSVGLGTNNPWVVINCMVHPVGKDPFWISNIISDGSGTNGVFFTKVDGTTYTLDVGTYSIDAIYGAYINDDSNKYGGFTLGSATISQIIDKSTYTITQLDDGTDMSTCGARTVLPSSMFTADGAFFTVTLGAVDYPMQLSHVSIGERWTSVYPTGWIYQFPNDPSHGGIPYQSTDTDKGGGTFAIALYQASIGPSNGFSLNDTPAGYDVTMKVKNNDGATSVQVIWRSNDGAGHYFIFNNTTGSWQTDSGIPSNDCIWSVTPTTSYFTVTKTYPEALYVASPGQVDFSISSNTNNSGGTILIEEFDVIDHGTSNNYITNNLFADWSTPSGSGTIYLPTEILFNNGQHGVSINSGSTAKSDRVYFPIDKRKDYLLIYDFTNQNGQNCGHSSTFNSDCHTYIRTSYGSYANHSFDTPTSELSNTIIDLDSMEVDTLQSAVCAAPYVIVQNARKISQSARNLVNQTVVFSDSSAHSGNNGYATIMVSFDGGKSWKFYLDGSAPPPFIASSWNTLTSSLASDTGGVDGEWYYINFSTSAWVPLTGVYNNGPTALSYLVRQMGGAMKPGDYTGLNLMATGGYAEGDDLRFAMIFQVSNLSDYANFTSFSWYDDEDFTLACSFVLPNNPQPQGVFATNPFLGAGSQLWSIFNYVGIPVSSLIVNYIP